MTFPSFSVGEVLTAADMNAVGLWEINTTTAAGTSTDVDITSCFSADYDSYRIVASNLTTAGGVSNIRVRLLATTTPATADYFYGTTFVTFAGTTGLNNFNGGANSYWVVGNTNTAATAQSHFVMDISRPFLAAKTQYSANMSGWDASWCGNGLHNAATSYNGIRFYSVNGNLTGTFRVYGYRN